MKLNLRRFLFEEETTLSYMLCNDVFECFFLEDLPRNEKIHGETCIPIGVYEIELKLSPHFGKIMPYLKNVPGFDGIMIHTGNARSDTRGCLICAQEILSLDKVASSKAAFDAFYPKLLKAWDAKERILISVENYVPLY